LNNTSFTIALIYSIPKHNIITTPKLTEFFNTIKNDFTVDGNNNAKHQSCGWSKGSLRGAMYQNFINVKRKQRELSSP